MLQDNHMQLMKTALVSGEVVICPTETVYGLCVLEKFRHKLDLLKGQPTSKPLAFVYSSVDDVLLNVEDPFTRDALIRLLPGPFTILMHKNDVTVGIRVPQHPFWSQFLDGITEPVLLTSANRHGDKPASDFQTATILFPTVYGYDGGPATGHPSKLIDLRMVR